MKYICAFSSDYRPLYRADIYKVASMPKGFVIHFRYKLKYIDQAILNNISVYINKPVVIFYTPNNKLDNSPENISVRKAILIKAEIINETGLFHAYMKLDDFCDIEISPDANVELIPSKKFFSSLDCVVKKDVEVWLNKIENLKPYFMDLSFYNIASIKDSFGKTKKPIIRNDKKSSYYKLNHGYKYFAELSLGNPDVTNCKIKFESSSDDISANIPNPIEVTAQYDNVTIPIYLKSLNVSTESSFISFIPENGDKINSEYGLSIEIEKGIGLTRPFWFGIFSLLTVLAVWIIKDNSESITNIGNWTWPINWNLVIASLILFISSSLLFSQFNKK